MDSPASRQDPRITAELRTMLGVVTVLRERQETVVRANSKARGSPADLDGQHRLGRFVWEIASQSLGVAGDHLEAWRRLIEEAHTQPGWAHMTLLRGATESASLCRWLIDPTATSAQRIQHGVAAQLRDWGERRRFEEASGADKLPRTGEARTGRQRVHELVEARRVNGVPEMSVPTFVKLCDDYAIAGDLGGNALYRLASAFAHGMQWTLLVSKSEPPPDATSATEPGPRRVSASDTLSAGVTNCAVRTFEAAVVDFEHYAGAEKR
jgi:hypothetical protein